jgi:hypothetical protein
VGRAFFWLWVRLQPDSAGFLLSAIASAREDTPSFVKIAET